MGVKTVSQEKAYYTAATYFLNSVYNETTKAV
ncbi:hypothetical protein SRABI27_00972 [Pedobacter sp. Bi27]|nr:hypothetical protein SRABI27_00972 [Pedobacter sp. Bi27]